MIWVLGVVLHLVAVGEPMIEFKLALYLGVCVLETYLLKHFTISTDTIEWLISLGDRFKGSPLYVLFPAREELNDRIHLWKVPLDMEMKFSKVTY